MALYNLIPYLITFYNNTLLASPHICLILTLWMSDSKYTTVVPLCFLVSGTKYSHYLLLNITLFDFFNIIFDWYESHDQVSKLLKDNSLCRLGNEISYHVICGALLNIKFLLTDMVSD